MQTDEQFITFLKTKTESELKEYVDRKYNILLSKHNKKHVTFGSEGAIEFISALFLADFDTSVTDTIYKGLDRYFGLYTGNPDDVSKFSDFMDAVVSKSVIKLVTWSEAFDYFYTKHKFWISWHPCGSFPSC